MSQAPRGGEIRLVEPRLVSFEAVLARYHADCGNAGDANPHGDPLREEDWTIRNLKRADRMFGRWVHARIAIDDIGGIVLPHHVGACDKNSGLPQVIQLVPPSGLTLAEAHARLNRIRDTYQQLAPYCYSRIMRAKQQAPGGLGSFFLSQGPLLIGSYGGLTGFRGRLTHLDGLHRLLGLMEASDRPSCINCYVARERGERTKD